MGSTKTLARERAVLLLFESDSKSVSISDVLANLDVAPEKYTVDLLTNYESNAEKVNGLIETYSKSWSMDRLPGFDRAALRMGITELVASDVPVGTIISEAVALCEQYSTPDSPRYINGVLGTVAHNVRGVEMLKQSSPSSDAPEEV
jgi:N utilization substance protein B